jgi:transcriptional regulator with XRE-family HTH domain
MNALQHIVAEKASPFCNGLSLTGENAWRHIAPMEQDESNGGPNHLRAWREFRKLSQEELAAAVETSHQVIGYLERGRTQLSAKWLRKLAPALDTTPGMLLDHDPNDLSADLIEMWVHASKGQRRQISDIAKTITRTGTDD